MKKLPLIVIGAGGHARTLLDTLLAQEQAVIAIASRDPSPYGLQIFHIPVLSGDDWILQYSPQKVALLNGIGMMPGSSARFRIYEDFKMRGYTFATVIHPSAILASHAKIAEGVQIMAGAIIQTGAAVGENCIINTRVTVEHDCCIGSHAHLASGSTVAGGVVIGEAAFIGAGAVIIQGIHIGAGCTVAAGSVVIHDIPDGAAVMGVPARMVNAGMYKVDPSDYDNSI